jgi:hypothetical protein
MLTMSSARTFARASSMAQSMKGCVMVPQA